MINSSVNRFSNSLVSKRQPTGEPGRWRKRIIVCNRSSVLSSQVNMYTLINYLTPHTIIRSDTCKKRKHT